MTRRRTPARRRPRRRKDNADWLLWLVAVVFLLAVAGWLIDLVVANWPLIIGLTVVLVAGLVGLLVLRQRTIDARQREWLRDNAHLERVDQMTGVQFESLVEALLRRDGFHKVRRVGGSGDGGVDVIGTAPTGDLFVVQCKRWAKSVGSPEVRNLLGALHAYPGHRGVLVATTRFTAPAKQCAVGTDLLLIDREQLAAWLNGAAALAPPASATGGLWPPRHQR
ncbi:restriction endonuclease [Streptosporangium sp. NBC_01755]|uniref:restriction endonuclease n=1 Tax=unclassified Streptosporangium TaxID=2632669 RepID=UPI002DDA0C2B|nr:MULTISPECIES: restriction endonuclease [unclassified Streptosporangium]WSA25877.1 restriction endonuclease [Streptosporangium sp. NBC_01810]WSD02730.1 restriction endonuclease [Streptosporangium sp. NBC_01755]